MKKAIKRIFIIGLFLIILGVLLYYKDTIYTSIDKYLHPYKYVVLDEVNDFYRDYDFLYVQKTDSFVPENKQDLLNIYYTVINSGKSSFTFYCTDKYTGCIKDIEEIANDQNILSDINNYVHPFNGFSHIETEYDTLGRVTISIMHNYSEERIDVINNKVNELSNKLINSNKSNRENIKTIHDYIINNTKYDSVRSESGKSNYSSDNAYGPLFEGYAVCGGYTDLMQLFLEKLNIKNYRISSEKHVWNAIYIDGKWYHLDLTWDDPVSTTGENHLEYNYFLIDTNKLLNIETTEHDFNKDHYLELKEV